MGLIEITKGKTVFLDSAPIIYVFENKEPYRSLLVPFYLSIDSGAVLVETSTLTIAEVLTKPYRAGESKLIESYRRFFRMIGTIVVSATIAEQAAQVRARHGLKTPDAIQWATARVHEADLFLTNDREFKKLNDPRVVLIDDLLQEKLY